MESNQSYPIVHASEDKLFTIVEKSEKEVIITIGNQIVSSKVFKDVKSAKQYIAKKPWELLVNTMCITFQKMKEYETTQSEH